MKFKKFGKALLLSALSAGVVLSVTSCVQSYTVGYLYVTGTVTSQSNGNGIISGFKIDHNTGQLRAINGLPVSSGGANPVRALLLNGSRFIYVLNRGVNASGGSVCTTSDPCQNPNITQFAVGANGILTAQQTFYTQGTNPFRMISDGNYLYVLDHDSPSSEACSRALGGSVKSCGDITAFQINQTTGRLQVLQNAQITSASGSPLPYFPVPADSIDFMLSGSAMLTLTGTPAIGDTVYLYQQNQVNGQLTLVLNGSDSIGDVHQATAIVGAGGYIYVLDNEAPSSNPNGATSQMLPFSVVSNALQAATSGPIPDDPSLSNPVYAITGGSSKWLYVANQGNNIQNLPQSGIAGYTLNGSQAPTQISGSPFGTGSGPQCLVQDPTNQFFYTANFNDSTVTGTQIDARSGILRSLIDATKAPSSYKLTGPPTWCLVDGRTN
jgi:6-phosphogluconolactonase